MGYTTEFDGEFVCSQPLTTAQIDYLKAFSRTRRMKRKSLVAEKFPDPKRVAVGLPIGNYGEYFVGSERDFGQTQDESIIEYNDPPSTQPGLWCKWEPTDDGMAIHWNGAEKFYDYTAWLDYIIANFLTRWGIVLNGSVRYQGEDKSDTGVIHVKDNVVSVEKYVPQVTKRPPAVLSATMTEEEKQKARKELYDVVRMCTDVINRAATALNEMNGAPPLSALRECESIYRTAKSVSQSAMAAIGQIASAVERAGGER